MSYEHFLAMLAENGWSFTDEEKRAGSVWGIQTRVLHCYIRLALTKDGQNYHVIAVNAFGPDDFSSERTRELGVDNITRSDFEDLLTQLTQEGVIPPCGT